MFKKMTISILASALIFGPVLPSWAKDLKVETIDRNVAATVYSLKKTKSYTIVEIGFKNTTSGYVAFRPNEIYVNDRDKYSVGPMPFDKLQNIQHEQSKTVSTGSLVGAIVLGIAGLAVGNSNPDAAVGLAIAALGLGGVFIISAILENEAKNNRLIAFKNNSLQTIDKIPPDMTLGGFLYFPPVKKPVSVTIMVGQPGGGYEKKTILVKSIKEPRKAKKHKYSVEG